MTKKTYWHADNTPVETTLDRILYDIRKDDKEGLIFDSISIHDIIEDSDGVIALDALITPYAKLETKMKALQKVMERSGTDIKPIKLTILEPFMRNGVANVTATFELSDGQGVTIFFHNPDVTPKKITATDELISYAWRLNKRDITIVVAPEKGVDLNIRQVAVRIMKLAQKNSAAFLRANTKSEERKQAIDDLKAEIISLKNELKQAQNRLEVAKVENDDREIAAVTNPVVEPETVEPDVEIEPDLNNSVDDENTPTETAEIKHPAVLRDGDVVRFTKSSSMVFNAKDKSISSGILFITAREGVVSSVPLNNGDLRFEGVSYYSSDWTASKINPRSNAQILNSELEVIGSVGTPFNPFDGFDEAEDRNLYDDAFKWVEHKIKSFLGVENQKTNHTDNAPTENTETIEPTGDENSPIEATLNGFSVSETIDELNNEYSTDNNVWNASVEQVQALSNDDYEKLIDALENANYHNYYNAVKALRKGDKALANEFNTLQKKQENAGHLTPELRDKRAELVDKLESVELGDNTPTETELSETNLETSDETPETLITAPNGSNDFGEITPEIAQVIKRQGGKIRLQFGKESPTEKFGIKHIESKHKQEIEATGLTTNEFVYRITSNPDSIRKADGGALLLEKDIKDKDDIVSAAVVRLKPDETGDFYRVETAFVTKVSRLEKKYPLLWEKSETTPSDFSNQTSFAALPPNEADGSRPSGTLEQSGLSENIPQPPENTIAEIDAELESLKSETDYKVFDKRLDDLAAKVEAAGLMDEYEPRLNDVADILTGLLKAANAKFGG